MACDLPALREVLRDGENAVLVASDDPGALAQGIRRLSEDGRLAERLAARGRHDAQAHTWPARAQAILEHVARTAVAA